MLRISEFSYLYQDGDGFHFMNSDTYDQVAVPADVIGDQAAFLQEGMKVKLSIHEGVAVSIELPPRVTLEVVETEPSMKGQTASGSFKPAKLSNGARTMVPTHIVTGTRDRDHDRRRLLRGTRQGLILRPAGNRDILGHRWRPKRARCNCLPTLRS